MNSQRLLRPPNVLAVDDQRANLVALDAVLGGACNLVFASSGAEAIAVLEARQDIDVVLMDVQMPGMDGFETASRIKQMESCSDVPIVFITAVYNEDPFIKQGYRAGAVDYFSKPFDPEILRMKVAIYAAFRQNAEMLKERARQLRQSEVLLGLGRRLAGAVENLCVGVVVTDAQGRTIHCNEEMARLWESLRSDTSDPRAQPDLWAQEGLTRAIEPLAHALGTGVACNSKLIETQSPRRCILCTATPLRDRDGRPAGAFVMFLDVTERKGIEKELQVHIKTLIGAHEEAIDAA